MVVAHQNINIDYLLTFKVTYNGPKSYYIYHLSLLSIMVTQYRICIFINILRKMKSKFLVTQFRIS